jgi:hypothetical protein
LFGISGNGPVIVGMTHFTAVDGNLPNVADYIFGSNSSEKQTFIDTVQP